MKDNISKANYITAAYDILSRDGVPAVTIRRLAEELRCNSANLYRYFDGLDELIIYASLKYLKSYINEVQQIYVTIEDNLELHFSVWECFSRYTFSYPEIFNNLFWGKYSSHLDRIIQDYYTIFPDELAGIDSYMQNIFRSGDFDYRDYLMLVRSVKDGRFTTQQAKYLNVVTMNLYKGFFKSLLDHRDTRDTALTQQVFLFALRRIFATEEYSVSHGGLIIKDADYPIPDFDSAI